MRYVVACALLAAGCDKLFGLDEVSNNAALANVQVVAPGYQTAASMSVTISGTAGNFLVAATYWHQHPDTITLTDTLGSSWRALDIADDSPTCPTGAQLWYATITTTGPNTVTVHQSNPVVGQLGLILSEYVGIDPREPVDAHAFQAAPGITNAVSAGTLLTTQHDLVIAFFNDTNASGTMAPGIGWTARAWDSGFYVMLEDDAPQGAPAGTIIPDATLPAGRNDACWVGVGAAFRTSLGR